jgi:hypothetical protein
LTRKALGRGKQSRPQILSPVVVIDSSWLEKWTLSRNGIGQFTNGLLDRHHKSAWKVPRPGMTTVIFFHMVLSIQYEGPIGRFAPKEENILWGHVGGNHEDRNGDSQPAAQPI